VSAPAWCQRAPEHATCAEVGHRSPILRVDPVRLQVVEALEPGGEGRALRPFVFFEVASGTVRLAFLLRTDRAGEVWEAFTQVIAWAGEAR
jgi:hypothetical protein